MTRVPTEIEVRAKQVLDALPGIKGDYHHDEEGGGTLFYFSMWLFGGTFSVCRGVAWVEMETAIAWPDCFVQIIEQDLARRFIGGLRTPHPWAQQKKESQ